MILAQLAKEFAEKRHEGQMYGEHPYTKHLQDVYDLACKFNLSENVKIAAWLHDTLEDTKTFTFEIGDNFGTAIEDIVYAVSGYGDNRKQRNADALRKILKNKEAARLKICDRIANIVECQKTDKKRLKMYLKEHNDFSEICYSLGYEDRFLIQECFNLINHQNLK